MAWPLGSDEHRGNALGHFELAEVDVEAVGANQEVARREVVADMGAEDLGLELVGKEDGDDIGLLHRLGGRQRLEIVLTASS